MSEQQRARRAEESKVVNAILREFGTRPDMRIWRNNTGAAVYGAVSGRRQAVQFGVVGQADISGIVRGGRRLEIECKSLVGRQSDEQRAFESMILRFGGIYILARSVEDVHSGLMMAGVNIENGDRG